MRRFRSLARLAVVAPRLDFSRSTGARERAQCGARDAPAAVSLCFVSETKSEQPRQQSFFDVLVVEFKSNKTDVLHVCLQLLGERSIRSFANAHSLHFPFSS